MPVSTQNVQVAECDAPRCTVRRVAEAPQSMPDGYQISVQVVADGARLGETVELWVCRATHIGPAAQDAMHRAGWRDRKEGPVLDGDDDADALRGLRGLHEQVQDDAERLAEEDANEEGVADELDGAPSTSRA